MQLHRVQPVGLWAITIRPQVLQPAAWKAKPGVMTFEVIEACNTASLKGCCDKHTTASASWGSQVLGSVKLDTLKGPR